jgi:DNA ligase (NAD+)
MRLTKTVLKELKEEPTNFATFTPISDLVSILKKLSEAYHSTDKPLVTDATYDILYDKLKERDPENSFLKKVGAPIISKEKVDLPFPMGSLNKIKPDEGDLEKWLEKYKGPYVISDKLDGISAQIYNNPKSGFKMYTRGEGNEEGNLGMDISHLLKYINAGSIKSIPSGHSIRGELIIKRDTFKKLDSKYKNIRNAVGGIVNKKHNLDETIAKNIDFVAYAIIHPELKQEQQMIELKKLGINIVEFKVEKNITQKYLEDYLKDRRKNSPYDVDGIVCIDSSNTYKVKGGNPDNGFAFKMILDDQFAVTTITNVIWQPTMDSYLKPIVEIEPKDLVGTTVSRATAYHAKYVKDNKIGIGAKIKIIRSGDVIPKIMEVITPAKEISLPDIPYVWNETKVDIVIDYTKKVPKEILDQVQIELILYFFRGIGVKYLSEGIITKLYKEGYKSVSSIIGADEDEVSQIKGLGDKMVAKIYKEIYSALDKVELYQFMAASHLDRGLGERKIKEILKVYPNILNDEYTREELIDKLKKVNGFSDVMSEKFADNIKQFKKFFKEIDEIYDISRLLKVKKPKKIGNLFEGKTIVFTGVRDKELEEFITNNGGKVSGSVSKNTNIVIHSDSPDKSSAKYKKAEDLKVELISITKFIEKYRK